MSLYSVVLVIHVTAVLLLCAALSIEVVSLLHLRGATSLAEAHPWMQPVPGLSFYAIASVLVILFSGGYLVMQESAFRQAWPKVAAVALLLMGPFGKLTDNRMRAIRNAYGNGNANPEFLLQLRDPFLKISLGVRIAVFLGIFLLVSAKPGLGKSISLVAVAAVLGLLSSLLGWRRNPSLPIPNHGD
jgi:hypothetical protein